MKKILVTGAAGFIGFHLVKKLSESRNEIVGLDNLNDYYDVNLKIARLDVLKKIENFEFTKIDLIEKEKLQTLFEKHQFDYVINLAAQAGVRYSIENPYAYIDSNIIGFINILEACRKFPVQHLIFASSSSVYGANVKQPFSEADNVDHPVSLYAATKKSNELMAHTYSSLYGIPSTGLRFFTVYGPWGRPDMAYFKFTRNIIEDKPIDVYNKGNLERDFTFIDDIVEGIERLIDNAPKKNPNWDRIEADPASSFAPYRTLNIGNNKPVKLMEFIKTLEMVIGKKAVLNFLEMQPGDVYSTFANIDQLDELIGFKPNTNIQTGLKIFVDWFTLYYS